MPSGKERGRTTAFLRPFDPAKRKWRHVLRWDAARSPIHATGRGSPIDEPDAAVVGRSRTGAVAPGQPPAGR